MIAVVVSFLVGVVAGFVVFLLTDGMLGPNLLFTAQTGDVFGPVPHSGGRQYRLLHVVVRNARRRLIFRWRDRTANFARCFVEFKDPRTHELILRMDGRWASGPQPFVAGQVDTAAVVIPQREILVLDEEFAIDIALKYDGQPHFYAFNNRSYLPSDDDISLAWTHRDKRLDQDHLLVEVEIWAEGLRKRSGTFLLRNPNTSLVNFELAQERP